MLARLTVRTVRSAAAAAARRCGFHTSAVAATKPHPRVPRATQYMAKPAPLTTTLHVRKRLALVSGGSLDSVEINFARFGKPRGPVVYVMPSMSHSALVTGDAHWLLTPDGTAKAPAATVIGAAADGVATDGAAADGASATAAAREKGWWEHTVGGGAEYGIDLNEFQVISASPLGAPYGTSSPVSRRPGMQHHKDAGGGLYRAAFPAITPADQAAVHAMLLDELGVSKVHAVVGSSMGGMAALQFAHLFPGRYDRLAALCTTARTSPSTVALRSVQRAAVTMDPKFRDGAYPVDDGPQHGMGVARKFGTICYRSRDEFDARFGWAPKHPTPGVSVSAGTGTTASSTPVAASASASASSATASTASTASTAAEFEIESYLEHAATQFQTRYDANCYLLLSRCMDRMDIGAGAPGGGDYDAGVARIPKDKHLLLLSVAQDALIPAREMERLAASLGGSGHSHVHYETLSSVHGHDAFLVRSEAGMFNMRLSAFLAPGAADAVQNVRAFVSSLHRD